MTKKDIKINYSTQVNKNKQFFIKNKSKYYTDVNSRNIDNGLQCLILCDFCQGWNIRKYALLININVIYRSTQLKAFSKIESTLIVNRIRDTGV